MTEREQRLVRNVEILAGVSDPSGPRDVRSDAGRRTAASVPWRAASSPACARSGRHVPVTTSAIALPASLPKNQAASTASACSTSHGTISGRPENKMTMTGLRSARARSNTASANTRCRPGRPRCARLAASPLMVAASPRHRRIASACAHSSSASAIPVEFSPSMSTPGACSTSRFGEHPAQTREHGDVTVGPGGTPPGAAHFAPMHPPTDRSRPRAAALAEQRQIHLRRSSASRWRAPPTRARAAAVRRGPRRSAARRRGDTDHRTGRAAASASAPGARRRRYPRASPSRAPAQPASRGGRPRPSCRCPRPL